MLCGPNFQKSIIVNLKPLNYIFCLTEMFQGMCCGCGERILAVQKHVSSSRKCDCHYYYRTSSKNLGNEPFHLQLPMPAIDAERSPLVCKPVKKSSVCPGRTDLHVCRVADTGCASCYVYRKLIPGLFVTEESKHPIKAICLSSYIF